MSSVTGELRLDRAIALYLDEFVSWNGEFFFSLCVVTCADGAYRRGGRGQQHRKTGGLSDADIKANLLLKVRDMMPSYSEDEAQAFVAKHNHDEQEIEEALNNIFEGMDADR
jgi:hypothetical protein